MEGFEKLQNSLLAAKQVMSKVDNKSYTTGNVDASMLSQDTNNLQSSPQQPSPQQTPVSSNRTQRDVKSNMSEDKIKGSNLPDNIKQLMLENPIPTVNFENNLSSDFIDEVAKKMEEQSKFTSGAQKIPQPTQPIQRQTTSLNLNEELKSFIKEAITETLDDIVESKLNKLMESNKEISENLQIRVGDSMFIGKITDVRNVK
jgi:translation elongation factor EF-G